ncbi:hypothetical protein [uncultured Pseudoteredinibacter sp.]|uniref:hypothetical protein n=1 Tax=uncultured Pseudoteredinibacter sp. TaxID=1641701 RepID=UPI00260CD26C|nr:hypothetical protein [uncultured Pseudoteredinibacter sp.]
MINKKLICAAALCASVFTSASSANEYSDLKLSVDESRLLARMNLEGQKDRFVVVERASKKVLAEVPETRRQAIDWCEWISKTQFACQFRSNSHHVGVLQGLTSLHVYDVNDQKERVIFGNRNYISSAPGKRFANARWLEEKKAAIKIVDRLPQDQRKILVLEYPLERKGLYNYIPSKMRSVSLSTLNIYTGRRELIKRMSYAEAEKYDS